VIAEAMSMLARTLVVDRLILTIQYEI